jgi:hypothetical protein
MAHSGSTKIARIIVAEKTLPIMSECVSRESGKPSLPMCSGHPPNPLGENMCNPTEQNKTNARRGKEAANTNFRISIFFNFVPA